LILMKIIYNMKKLPGGLSPQKPFFGD